MTDQTELAAVREIHAHLPFAHFMDQHPLNERTTMADFALLPDGTRVDTKVDFEIITDNEDRVRRVLIDGVDMTHKIVRDGINIRPGDINLSTRVDVTFAAKSVTFTRDTPHGDARLSSTLTP